MSSSTRIVLITGANSGIGFAIAQVLLEASETYHIVIASRTLEKASAAKSELEAAGTAKGRIFAVQLEVTDDESINQAAAYVEKQFGRLDVLINNAGIGLQIPDVKTRWTSTIATNLIGPVLVSAAFRPLLLKTAKPYSLYVSSGQRTLTRNGLDKMTAHGNIQYVDAYPTSKAALNHMAVIEQRDFREQGLMTCVFSPGFVRSNLRGHTEEARSGWGGAGDARQAGELVLEILEGKRDKEMFVGLVHKSGVWAW